MSLGLFSVSLNVEDLAKSKEFYETLGFKMVFGEEAQGWVIMTCGDCKIGLFQGMFENNILTFNPGWDSKAQPLDEFEDIRTMQKRLIDAGIEIPKPADETTKGPASFMVVDPDGNPILIDQHV